MTYISFSTEQIFFSVWLPHVYNVNWNQVNKRPTPQEGWTLICHLFAYSFIYLFIYLSIYDLFIHSFLIYLLCIYSFISLFLFSVWHLSRFIQYIPRNMHTVTALLCFVVVLHWLVFPYPSGLLHWHCGNLTIAPVPAKQPWWIWINTSCEFIMNDCITTTKEGTTKPCAYFLGYTVQSCRNCHSCNDRDRQQPHRNVSPNDWRYFQGI